MTLKVICLIGFAGLAAFAAEKKVPVIDSDTQIAVLATTVERVTAIATAQPYLDKIQAADAAARVPFQKAQDICGKDFVPELKQPDGTASKRVICSPKPPEPPKSTPVKPIPTPETSK